MKHLKKLVSLTILATLLFGFAAATFAQQQPQQQPQTRPGSRRPQTPRATTKRAATNPPAQKPVTSKPAPKPAADSNHKPADNPAPPPIAPIKETPKPAASIAPTEPQKIETDPAVLSALDLPREKPADYLRTVLLLIDLGRPELAKPIFADLLKQPLTDADRQQFVDQFGSGSMLKLSRTKELAPDGATFAQTCLSIASAAANNPQHIADLIKQLSDPLPETRLIAQHDLASIGPAAATATIEAFAKETDRTRRGELAMGVAAMHPLVDRMLLAMLDTKDATLRTDVADILRHLQVPQADPLLYADDPHSGHDLATFLYNYQHGTPVFEADADQQVELWQWNDATKQLSPIRLPADQAQILWMSKLARALSEAHPDNAEYRHRANVLTLEAAELNPATRNSPAMAQQLDATDPQRLNDLLAQALRDNQPHAAVALINALSRTGDRKILSTSDGKPSPIADALTNPNRSVRFAALSAIMAFDPTVPYPGSSRVPEAVAYFAASSPERRALIAMPQLAAASDLAGQLVSTDLVATPFNNGHDLLTQARQTSDIEAIFVDMDLLLPQIREVLYELRMNPATGDVPIALLAADGRLEAAKRLAEEHQRVIAMPRPHSKETVAVILKQLAALADSDAAAPNTRAAQAAQAKTWLAKIESGDRPFYVVRHKVQLSPERPRTPPAEKLPKK